jgi:type IV pilus assembly protein PilN
MTRINLLERPKASGPAFDPARHVAVFCGLVVLAAALLVGLRVWSLQQESSRLQGQLAEARQESTRLQGVLEQAAEFDARKSQLQQRVSLIEELRRGQSGPVHLLDELSRSVPDRLWLTEMKHEKGEVTVQGRTSSLTALSDFVANLEASGYFTRPVEIVDSKVESVQGAGDLVRFTVKAVFLLPGSVPDAPASPAAGGGGTRRQAGGRVSGSEPSLQAGM